MKKKNIAILRDKFRFASERV